MSQCYVNFEEKVAMAVDISESFAYFILCRDEKFYAKVDIVALCDSSLSTNVIMWLPGKYILRVKENGFVHL